jgi:branched-chain amino acid transport system substrate-binding protein
VVTIGENYSFPHTEVGAFMIEFLRAGGHVVKKIWTAVGQQDYTEVIDAIPDDVDAVLAALGGADVIEFLKQYQAKGKRKPLIGGAITTDQSVLSAEGISTDYLIGLVAAGPTADDNSDPLWKSFVEAYRSSFSDAFNYPSLFAIGYYLNAKAALLALESVGGDLSNGQARLKSALNKLTFTGPCGPIRLDHYRQAVSTNYITTVARGADGKLYRKCLQAIPDVEQTLGVPEEEYLAIGSFTADNPPRR